MGDGIWNCEDERKAEFGIRAGVCDESEKT
jgi:hypothetical protein